MLRGRKICYIVIVAAVASMIISGCVSKPPEITPTVSPTISPVVTPTPTPIPKGVSVEVLKAPDTAAAGQSFEVVWRVNSPSQKQIPHTAVHYGSESKSEPLTLTSYPALTKVQNGTIPANFSAMIVINSTGTTYFRAHAIVDGVSFWSEEKTITISSSLNATPAATLVQTTTPGGYRY